MSLEDQPTQQLRTTQPPTAMPGPLDLTAPSGPEPDSTEVLSLDDLLGPVGTPSTAPAPTRAPMAVVPVRSQPELADPAPVEAFPPGSIEPARSHGPSLLHRLRVDAQTAFKGAHTRGRTWLETGDNALVVLTVIVALLLIAVIAAV